MKQRTGSILTYAPLRGVAARQTSPLLHVTAQAKEQSINKTPNDTHSIIVTHIAAS